MTFAKGISGAATLAGALLLGSGLFAPSARAAFIETLVQQGTNVVATGSGTIDAADLSLLSVGYPFEPYVIPYNGVIVTGMPGVTFATLYRGVTGPTSFGSGSRAPASSGSRDLVGIVGGFGSLVVPRGYVSGSPLSSISSFDNQTFASLGVTPGTYVWTWGSGADADSFTLDVRKAAVLEPSSVVLLTLPLGLVMLLAARRDSANGAPDQA